MDDSDLRSRLRRLEQALPSRPLSERLVRMGTSGSRRRIWGPLGAAATGVLTVAVVLTIGREWLPSGATSTDPPSAPASQAAPSQSASPPASTPRESASVAQFVGTYTRVELGCHFILTDAGELYELILPEGVRLDEARDGTWRLVNRDGSVIASEGDRLAANGRVTESGGSFCGWTVFLEVSEFVPMAD